MKYLLYIFLLPSTLFAQTINIDSLERKGYHVYVHKQHKQRKTMVKHVVIRDTVWRERTIIKHDTVRTHMYIERTVTPQYILLAAPQVSSVHDRFTLALVGTGNTNGYEMHLGSTLALGERILFFIGAGCSYNSVLKRTRLDLGGHLVITLLK